VCIAFYSKNKIKDADFISVDKSPMVVSNNATDGDDRIYNDDNYTGDYDGDDNESTCCYCFGLVL